MKLFTKIALGIAGFLGSIAVLCALIAFTMGFTLSDFREMVYAGKFSFGPEDAWQIHLFDEDDVDVNHEQNVIKDGQNSSHHADVHHESNADEHQFDIPHACKEIYVEYGAGALEIRYADVSCVQITQKNVEKFSLTTSDVEEKVIISGGLDISDSSDAVLTILLPRGTALETLKLEIGASLAKIDGIIVDELEIVVGVGEANLSNVITEHLDLEVGAGCAEVTGLSVENLDVEVGIGEVDMEIAGMESDYNYQVECGIGKVKIGRHSYSGLGAEEKISNEGASKEIDIECGIGEVNMQFTGRE